MINWDDLNFEQLRERGVFIHSPAQLAGQFVEYVHDMRENASAFGWGVPSLDNRDTGIPKPGRGQTTVFIGRPGAGKTMCLTWLARRMGREAARMHKEDGRRRIVLYVSWEQDVEDLEKSFQSGPDWTREQIAWREVGVDTVMRGALKRASLPIWTIGRSVVRDTDIKKPKMTIDVVRESIELIHYTMREQVEIVGIFADYAQKIPITGRHGDRIAEVTEAIYELSSLAVDVGVPLFVGSQATRTTDEQGFPMPTLGGSQWSSAMEQEAYRVFGITRPAIAMKQPGSHTDAPLELIINGVCYPVDHNMLILKLVKLRDYFPPNAIYPIYLRPDTLEAYDYVVTDNVANNGKARVAVAPLIEGYNNRHRATNALREMG